jgi:hypothetical protein
MTKDTSFSYSFQSLKNFCEQEQFKGYDPYDGLNSSFFNAIPFFSNNRFVKLVWIQFFKRFPFNIRPLVGIKKDYNPKALGLFLSAYCNLYKIDPSDENLNNLKFFSKEILKNQNKEWSGSCWGYNFDWQARAFFQPKNTPTVVASTFIACALLDAYDILKDPKLLEASRSTCDFILKDLNRTYDEKGNFSFSYSPLDKSVVFNASLLGSRLLSRVYFYTKEPELLSEAKKSVQFCCDYQKMDGSWSYGTYDFHQWIDNFHTGYNLECIYEYQQYSRDFSFQKNIDSGFKYYIENFFTPEGIPKYYNNSIYPVDIHTTSQLIVTTHKLDLYETNKELVDKVLNWTIQNMQSKKGYFYFQKKKVISSKIPYMRWAQAWMFYAFSIYFIHEKKN